MLLELVSGPGSGGDYNCEMNVNQSMLDLAAASQHDPSYGAIQCYLSCRYARLQKCWSDTEGRNGPGATLSKASGSSVENGIRWYFWDGNDPITAWLDPFDIIVIPWPVHSPALLR